MRRGMSERVTHIGSEQGLRPRNQKEKRVPEFAGVGHVGPVATGDAMKAPHALAALAALGQPTRLEIFRLLVRHEPSGMSAGSVAENIGCPHNTLSSHLGILARAGLIHGSREGKAIFYRAHIDGMRALIAFLITDCCDSRPEVCNLTNVTNDPCR